MNQELWSAVDTFVGDALIPADPVLEAALQSSEKAGLPAIQVSPAQGKFLHLLAKLQGAKTILEIGTLGGYSTIWLARALPSGGRLVTLEYESKHAEVARANIARAGLSGVVDIRVGKGLDLLPKLEAENIGPFDLVFIDADKPSTPEYFQWALKMSRPGTLIVADNVVRKGALADPASTDPNVVAMRRLHAMVSAESRVSATTIQTVGNKGYDGFTLAVVNE